MDPAILVTIISIVFFLVAVFSAAYVRRTQIVQILDYQIGLRFRRGESYTNLPPGCYRTGPGLDPITVVDLRPRQFILERLTFRDALHASSILSVGGEFMVSDPPRAVNTMKELLEDSLAVIRENILPAASRSILDVSNEGKERLAAALIADLNRALESRGVMIRNLEVTELWAQPVTFAHSTEAN